jgi:signal transduction histidine kinase
MHNDALRSVNALDFKLLFEQSPDVLLVLLPDAPRFTIVAATDARLLATHTTRESTLGRPLFEVFPDNPENLEANGTGNLRASLERVLATQQPDTMAVQKYDIRGPDGSFQSKYWSPKNIPILSASGEIAYILHRVEDVTELVEASERGEQLRDRTKQMEREVISRSRELANANQSLREANTRLGELDAAKTAFFSNVSHEFRTPLTLILGPLDDALSTPTGTLNRESLEAVHRNALRLLKLVNSLLDFARIEAGRMTSSFEPVDLATLTGGLAGSFQSLLESAGLRLIVDCPAMAEPVWVDRSQWEKIVLNLVSNAYKFTFEGAITIRLHLRGERVELSVSDTGTGIPTAELPKVFNRFHRVAGAKGRSFEGTGIGLALVKELVRLHGGTVQVESVEGRGTTFVVSVPTGNGHLPQDRITSFEQGQPEMQRLDLRDFQAWHGTAPLLEPSSAAQPRASAVARILVADDNADMRHYLLRLLEPYWRVELTSDGKAALECAQRDPPDLVLSDVMMPEMDGAALISALRAEPRTSTIPVILLSARAGEEAVVAGLETGADDYLVKPFSARELLGRVRTHLALAQMRRTAAEATQELAETRRALVEELEAKNQDLETAYRELQLTQAQLVQSAKMASLGGLVAGVAHEINNPLSFALGHLDTVQRSLQRVEAKSTFAAGDTAPHWQRAVGRLAEIDNGLRRIQELVLKLRMFSRLDEGERKVASMRENVESVLTILRHRYENRIEVSTAFSANDLVECYPSLLNQALLNLVSNAIDAIDGNGSISIVTRADSPSYAIAVSDSGCGIPDAIRERVIEPFFTTKPIGQGVGLGLSITYSIVKKHGGELELRPRAQGGTIATLRIPLVLVEP